MLLIIYFSIAVGVSFLCSILEAVLLSISASHIELVKQKNKKLGLLMEKQKDDIDFSIAAILTLNTFAHTLGAAGVGAEAAKIFGEEYMFYISAVLTILILVFSEIIPKTLGAYYWKNLAGFSTRVIKVLVYITYPIIIVMKKITVLLADSKKNVITKEEIIATAKIADENGIIRSEDSGIIENVLQLHDIRVKDILTPRSVVYSIQENDYLSSFDSLENNSIDLKKLKEYSRIPIFRNNIDDMVGLIISKEYFYEKITNELENKLTLVKPILHVNENVPVSKLIDMFIESKEHMYLVVDNYGQTEGIVTLEDAVETLLGREIVDELDSHVDMRKVARRKMLRLRAKKNIM